MYKLNEKSNPISPAIIQFTLALILIILFFLDKILGLPTLPEMAIYSKSLFLEYGYIVLVIAAFFEAFFMLSLYFPGSFVIILSVIISDKSIASLAQVGFYSLLGFAIANIINYYLGKFGYYRLLLFLGKKDTIENMKIWLDKNSNKTLFLSAIHPNFLSVAIVCLGIAGKNFIKIILKSTTYLAFWITVWIVVATPFLKTIDIESPNQVWYLVAFFILWGLFNIARVQVKKSKN